MGKQFCCMTMTEIFINGKDGKHLYNIIQFTSIIHTHSERNSIYDEYGNMQVKYKSVYSEPMDDWEI